MKENNRLSLLFTVLGSVLFPIAIIVWWLNFDILNTGRYVELITPVVTNPAVQTSLSNYLTDTIFERVDTTEIIRNALPQQSNSLVFVINEALINFSKNLVLRVVQSEQFVNLWSTANQIVHQQISQLLLDQGRALTLQNGEVAIDLNQVVNQVKTRLSERGLNQVADAIPEQNYNYALFKAPVLTRYQGIVSFIDSLFPWIQILTVIFFGLAIWFSSNRIKSINSVSIGVLISLVALAIIIGITRSQYIQQTVGPYYTPEVAAVFFDALTRPLWVYIILFALLGITGIVLSIYLPRLQKNNFKQ